MKTSLRQKLVIAVGLSAGLLASMNLFAQEARTSDPIANQYSINSQSDYLKTITSINELAARLYSAHQKYPQLSYSHVYSNNGELMGFTVSGVSRSSVADEISGYLMQLEAFGNAVHNMDNAYLPESNSKLTSRISKKRAIQSIAPEESENTMNSSGSNPNDFQASLE